MELSLNHITQYDVETLQLMYKKESFDEEKRRVITPTVGKIAYITIYDDSPYFAFSGDAGLHALTGVKPVLYPLDYLTKEIEHNGERFVPIDWFEIGDEDNNIEEFDHGNIKLIKNLGWAALDSSGHDARMLPYAVVLKLFEWKFDMFHLIDQNLAIDINSLEENPYK